jgi:hypothetical protein
MYAGLADVQATALSSARMEPLQVALLAGQPGAWGMACGRGRTEQLSFTADSAIIDRRYSALLLMASRTL